MSDYRSYGSNYHQSSQSRKISIGVFADSKPARNPGDEDVVNNTRVEKLKSATVTDVHVNKKDKGELPLKQKNVANGTEPVTSPWRSRKLGTLENVLRKEPSSSKVLNKEAPARDSFQNIPPPSAVLQEKVVELQREKEKNGTTVALRSKLFEILGKASPVINNEDVSSETQGKAKLSQDNFTKPDSIETDSESPEKVTTRPVTRSLLQRKLGGGGGANKAGVQEKATAGANLARKTAEKVNNIFSFEEGLREEKTDTAMPKKRGRRKNTVVQCRKKEEISKSKTPPRPVRTRAAKKSLVLDKKGSTTLELNSRKQKPAREEEEEIHPSPEGETAPTPEVFRGLSKTADKQERPSIAEVEKELQSPTFGDKAANSSPSPQSSPEAASPLHPRNIRPALEETEAQIFSFGTKKTCQVTKGKASATQKRLPASLKKKGVSSFRKESSPEPNEDLVMSDPSSDEKSSDESGDESPALDDYNSPEERETADWSHEKTKRASSSAKRNSNLKGKGRVVVSPTSSLSKGPEEIETANRSNKKSKQELSSAKRNSNLKGIDKTNSSKRVSKMDEDIDEDEEEEQGRDSALFTLALKDFEKKLKSAAKKKASDIIALVSEEINQELENIKSKIMTETGKRINLAKTKRKHAETQLQEQQEKMKLIHDKFNEDVGHQLEDFKTTIEGLEANHLEMKRTIKKQRTSYQKLIAQFEGGIDKKLDNATKKVDSVNKSARGKLVQMKKIMAECLKDDVLG